MGLPFPIIKVWYLETGAGHQWVAARIPDNSYAICPNIMVIQDVDFSDPDNFMWSEGIQEFVEKNHLNNSTDGSFSFRDIFGTKDEADAFTTHQELGMVKVVQPKY